MGLNSKSEKRSADVSLLDEVDNDEKPNKRLKPIDSKGGINAIIAEDWKTSSGPPSPVPFLSPDGRISKPAEIFRTDLISAMKLPDTQILNPENYMTIVDPWRQEWERGVQVPVHPEGLPQPSFSLVEALKKTSTFKLPGKLLNSEQKRKGKSPCNYDLNRMDVEWLTSLNKSRRNKGRIELEEEALEKAIAYLEDKCYENLGYAIVTQEGLSIEYDESVCCEVCQSPDSEEGNEMVFCDSCDICVHQACYGIQTIPHGSWLCQPCGRGVSKPPCQLCLNAGGAMKKTKKGKNWVHVSCALWVPEVGFGSVERMEPIIKLENIPASRWNLTCYLCREKVGACIQCTVKSCMTAFHVTCGFKNNLEMRTILDDAAVDGVRHLCYCGKHSHKNKSPPRSPEKFKQDAEDAENLRQKRLKQMEMEFHKYVDVSDAAKDLNIPKELAVHVHAFWTLKRKARDDVPLLPPTLEQQEKLCGKQGAASRTLQIQIEELMKMRCDLERLRNLCYMVSKREKTRRELFRTREQVFWKAHEVMIDESITMGDGDLLWVREACGKNFSGDGSEPSGRLDGPGLEPVSAPTLQLNTSGQSSADDVAGERTHSDEPSSESDVRDGYESSDSEDSPQIRTRRRFRGSATHKSQRDVVNRIRSNTKDTQKSTGAQKSRGAKDSADTEQTAGEDEESRIQGCHTPRRSLRFHRAESQDGSSDDSRSLSSCKTASHHPQEHNDEPPQATNRRRHRTVTRGDADEKMDSNSRVALPRPRTRGQTSESTSEDSVSESTRTESPAARLSPTRLLRSCKQEPEVFGRTVKTARSRSKSVGDDASNSVRETRSTRLSKSEDEVSSNEAAKADHQNRTTPTPSSPEKLILQKEETLNNELTENYIKARRGRQRTASLNDSLPPPKKRRIDVQRPSKVRSKRKVNGTILDDDSSDVQHGIQALFYKHSPKRKPATVTSKVEFHNGRKSSRSSRSTESESSKSDEENAVDRVQRLSSLRSFNTSKECHLPPSPCPKCQFQQDKDSPTESRSPERKNKELRPRNMQSPRSRNRLLSSLRYSPTRSCANMITQVCHTATVV